jgi:peptidoglycan/LPS O-acetylase OafA/YrhL
MPRVDSRRLGAIDVLRGIAALSVVCLHVRHHGIDRHLSLREIAVLPIDFGYLGVPLFLVISGFCIHLTAASPGQKSIGASFDWRRFWRRRFHRLYPPYLVAIGLSLAGYYLSSPGAMQANERIVSLPWDLLTHLLMLQNLFVNYLTGLGNGPLWTLGLEEQLYALYPVYILLRRRVRVVPTLFVVGLITMVWRFGAQAANQITVGPAPLEIGVWDKWPPGYWLFWVLGAVAAEAYTGAIHLPAWCYSRRAIIRCALIGVLLNEVTLGRFAGSAALISWDHTGSMRTVLRYLTTVSDPAFGICFFILINRSTALEKRAGMPDHKIFRWLRTIGLMSYSLYLVHLPVIHLVETMFSPGQTVASTTFRYLVFVPICLGVGAIFFHLVERHFLNRRRSPVHETVVAT